MIISMNEFRARVNLKLFFIDFETKFKHKQNFYPTLSQRIKILRQQNKVDKQFYKVRIQKCIFCRYIIFCDMRMIKIPGWSLDLPYKVKLI